jgi:parallel beta-helix repeat protein
MQKGGTVKNALNLCIIGMVVTVVITSTATMHGARDSISKGDSGVSVNKNGNTLYVGGSGPGNYTAIQEAIDDASDGDTVFVYSGTYAEVISVNKSIAVVGQQMEVTTISGMSRNVIVNVTADGATVKNFTLIKAGFNVPAVKVTSQNNCLQFCDIRSGYPRVCVENSHNFISHCLFSNGGRAIDVIDASNVTIRDCSFHSFGIGVNAEGSSEVVVERCSFSENGVGVSLTESDGSTVTGSEFSKGGWGIKLANSTTSLISSNDMRKNYNGVILVKSSENEIDHCVFSKNDFGVTFEYSTKNSIVACNFTENHLGIHIRYRSDNNRINHCDIRGEEYSTGIWFSEAENNIVERNDVYEHDTGIYAELSNKTVIRFNNIYGNRISGLKCVLSVVNARFNYWDSPFGPTMGNLSFRGEKIILEVNSKARVFPWKLFPANTVKPFWAYDARRMVFPTRTTESMEVKNRLHQFVSV